MMHNVRRGIEKVPYISRHPSNFKVTRAIKSTILTRIERFKTVTPVCFHRWLWNDAQSLKGHGRDVPLFSLVICQIARTPGPKNQRFHGFESDLSKITGAVAAIKSIRFALFYITEVLLWVCFCNGCTTTLATSHSLPIFGSETGLHFETVFWVGVSHGLNMMNAIIQVAFGVWNKVHGNI